MKVSKSKVNEGFWSDFAQDKAKINIGGKTIFAQKNAELRNDPRIIAEVAGKGFLDFRDRLAAAGINLKNAAAISTPETQDTIKVNLIQYVERYFTEGESQAIKGNILIRLQKLEKDSLPSSFNEKTILEYFQAAAKIRAEIVVSSEKELPVSDILKKVKLLQSQLPNNTEIVFPFNGASVIIRKDKENSLESGIYITDWTKLGTTLAAPGPQTLEPHSSPVYELTDNKDDEAAKAEHLNNLTKIYSAFVRTSPRPVPQPIAKSSVEMLSELQKTLEDNQEINFNYNFTGAGGTAPTVGTNIVIRKDGVYVSDYINSSTSTREPKKVPLDPHGDMFLVQRPNNLENIYSAYTAIGSPAPTEYVGKSLE